MTAIALSPAKPLFPMLVRAAAAPPPCSFALLPCRPQLLLNRKAAAAAGGLLSQTRRRCPVPLSNQPMMQTRPRDYFTIILFLAALAASPLCLLWTACCALLWPLGLLLGWRPWAWMLTWHTAHHWLHSAFCKACGESRSRRRQSVGG